MIINDVTLKKMTHDGIKVKKWIHDGVKVWSGATVVSYYDGSTLIDTREVDEGLDVAINAPTISNKYLWGWSDTDGGKAKTIIAQGETMTVYADASPNPITIYSPWTTESRILKSSGTTYLAVQSINNTVSSGWSNSAVIDVTNLKQVRVSGYVSKSLSYDASGESYISFALGGVGGSSWDVSDKTGNMTLQMSISAVSWGPWMDEIGYTNDTRGYLTAIIGEFL